VRYDLSFLTDELTEVQGGHESTFESLCRGDQPGYVPTYVCDVQALPHVGPYEAEEWLEDKLRHFSENAATYRDEMNWRPFALSLARYDLHFASAVMGSPVFRKEEGPVWWTPLSQLGVTMEDFRAPALDENPLFQEMLRLLKFTVEATEARIPIEIPYVSEPLVAAVDLFREDFLAALVVEPELAERLLDEISYTILEMRRQFVAAAPGAPLRAHGFTSRIMPRTYTLLYECTTQLVSSEMYRRHVLHRDQELFECHAAGGGIHLCGHHTQHIPAWQAALQVKVIQLNDAAADDLETYWRSLRPDQFIIFMPTAHTTVEDALRITGGRQLVVNTAVEERIPLR